VAFDTRHRNKDGEISRKHGNTLIHTLRKTYGPRFVPGCADHAKLSDVLGKLDELSLSHLIRDHSQLIEASVKSLSGVLRQNFRPDGFTCSMNLQLSK
jgi:hypothetical protein